MLDTIMKYIRTKDGNILNSQYYKNDGKGWRYNVFNDCYSIHENDIVKQADNIEDLCDAYVITSKQGHIYDTYGDYGHELEQVLPQARIEEPDEDWDLYGCVLVNGIIKQVAKFNDEKGELELL